MKLELFLLIKRLSSRTRAPVAKNVIMFEGALELENDTLLRHVLPLGGFLNTPLVGLGTGEGGMLEADG